MGLRNFTWLVFMSALWGPSFLFIKVAVEEIPPLTLAACRVGLACILLYIVVRIQRRNLSEAMNIKKHFFVMGFIAHALPFALFNWGEIYVDSALASILNGITPLFTIVLAHFLMADDRMTPEKVVGIILGFSGLLLLLAPSLIGGIKATTWGSVAIIAAAACYGIAIIYSRKYLRGLPPLVAPTTQLAMAALYLIPLSLIIEEPLSIPVPSWPAIGSLLGLSILGTALAFIIYYRLLEIASATYLSMVTYLVPVFGVILGVVVLNERLDWNSYAGCALILLGVMSVNGVFKPVYLMNNK